MNKYEFQWNSEEKKIARKAFEKAYETEMAEIKSSLLEKTAKAITPKDIWAIHDFLSKRRNLIDAKYDYRYSKLILVFSRLIKENYISLEELTGLSDEKLEMIKSILSLE